jgi:methylglyoxal synthase
MDDKDDFTSPSYQAFARSGKRAALGFIAAPTFRRQDTSSGANLVRGYLKTHMAVLKEYFIFTTQGTYDDTIHDPATPKKGWKPAWPQLKGYELGAGKLGGLVEMAALIEKREVNSAVVDGPVRVLMLLSLPVDQEESYPEARALLRCAMRNNAVLLTTKRASDLWITYEARKKRIPDTRSAECVALIAHDGMKLNLCEWVVRNRHSLKCFQRIVTTGTTGKWVERFLKASDIPLSQIHRMYSGPEGGDVQITEEILRRKIRHVVFFVDPMTSHPHEADIQTLVRVCALPELEINLRLTEAAASSWIEAYRVL